MKSFFAYPLEIEAMLYPENSSKKQSGKFVAHYELFKKVHHLNGAIVKCGITAAEGFTRFAMFREMLGTREEQKMIAFEKKQNIFEEIVSEDGNILLEVKQKNTRAVVEHIHKDLAERGIAENVDFVPGSVSEAIPEYLMQNPELKIALLNIDLDEYDSTITTLEFLFPRIMPGGILVIDNFYKNLAEHKAVTDYFLPRRVVINNFSVNNGPHYIVKP